MVSKMELISSVWIKFVPEKRKFGIKTKTFFGEENVTYADEVDFSFIFPARPRPGISRMNISTQGIVMQVNQPFTISGELQEVNGKEVLALRLHHQK
ncbi:MAG: hypothetical protein ACTSRZ_05380 [Promethearchaeota archaeon]